MYKNKTLVLVIALINTMLYVCSNVQQCIRDGWEVGAVLVHDRWCSSAGLAEDCHESVASVDKLHRVSKHFRLKVDGRMAPIKRNVPEH